MITKSCCFTGHRPEKLPWGANEDNPDCIKLKSILYLQIEQLIRQFGITHYISGMARGVDTYAAEIVLQIKKAYSITLECAIPYVFYRARMHCSHFDIETRCLFAVFLYDV